MNTPSSSLHPFPSLPEVSSSATASALSTEVPSKVTRRRFTLSYKRKIVALAQGLPEGELGALLRREGLYSSHLCNWRKLVARQAMTVLEPKRGRKPNLARPDRLRIEKLERQLLHSQRRLVQAEAIIDAQKKLCALLGLPSSEEGP